MNLDTAALAEGLDRAIDELLAVRVALSDRPIALPDLALDEVLRQHAGYQDARAAFAVALDEVLVAAGDENREKVLALEGVANVLIWRAAEAVWRLAIGTRSGGGGR